ncbi:MAG: hypothetical protein J0L52_09225 [Caulobacterales bacterium]|nr:hypothetical protein [Caulobacterales bacterium]
MVESDAGPPPTQARLAVVIALAGLIGLVLVGGHGAASVVGVPTDGEDGDAYSRFVRDHFLADDRRRLVLNSDPDSSAPIVDLTPEVYQDPDGVYFQYALRSHLMQDIRRNDPSLWRIENGIVTGIQAGHSTPPPFPRPVGAWRGTLRYRAAVEAVGARNIELAGGPGAPLLILTPGTGPTGTGDPRVTTIENVADVAGRSLEAAGFDISCGGPDAGVVRIRRIGDAVAVLTQSDATCRVDAGPAAFTPGQASFEVLARGERLRIRGEGSDVTFHRRFASPDIGRISAPSAGPDRYRVAELASWSAAFERDLHRAVSGSPPPSDDIETTLDRELQLGAQEILDSHFAGLGDDTSIGTITILDALSGEVLAMAGRPGPLSGAAGGVLDLDDPLEQARRRNQNLARLSVGSAVKPLIAAAILQRHPELLGLQIRGQTEADELLGYPFERPLANHATPAWIDFNGFIRDSDNLYAAALALMGSPDVNGLECQLEPGQGYRLGSVGSSAAVRTERPKSVFETIGPDGRCRPALLEHDRQLRWVEELEDLFDVEGGFAEVGGDCQSAQRIRSSPWAALLDRYNRLDMCQFRESVPEVEALGLAGPLDFRTGAVPIILGNGDGRWSTVGLAQAYARLITGAHVTATFTPATSPATGDLGLNPEVRQAITHAMTLVTSGTASGTELPAALTGVEAIINARGLVLGAFVKTGTPIIASSRYRPSDRVINALIRYDRIRLASGTGALAIRTSQGELILAAESSAARRQDIASRLAADPVALEVLRRQPGTTAASVVERLAWHLEAMSRGDRPFVIHPARGGGLLVRVASRDEIVGGTGGDDDPSGKVVALVVAAYAPERVQGVRLNAHGRADDGRARPQRAYVVVVNLQRESTGGNAAADLAARIAERLLAERLVETVRS